LTEAEMTQLAKDLGGLVEIDLGLIADGAVAGDQR
jgi:hypothetical protein